MSSIAKEAVTYCNGVTLVNKNTFLDIPSESVDNCRQRRQSAPDLVWRYSFSLAPITLASPTTSRSSHAVEEITDAAVHDDVEGEDNCTLMIKNIPCCCKPAEVKELLERFGFLDLADFFYVPTQRNKILGYAFIGFPGTEVAEKLRETLTGYQMPQKKSTKVLSVVRANIQGAKSNWEHFKDTSAIRRHAGPVFRGTQ